MVGTVEDFETFMRDRKVVEPERPRLTSLERMVVGQGVRVEIPVNTLSSRQLGTLADKLHGLANAMAFAAQRTDLDEYHRLLEIRRQCDGYKRAVKEMTKLNNASAIKEVKYKMLSGEK